MSGLTQFMFKREQLSRFGFISQDQNQRQQLVAWIGRRILEARDDRSVSERLAGLFDPNWLDRYGRSYGADSAESKGSTKAGFSTFFEKGSETSLVWNLDRKMENKSFEELASFARELLGKSEPCTELNRRITLQTSNPLSTSSKFLVFLGDYVHVRGTLF